MTTTKRQCTRSSGDAAPRLRSSPSDAWHIVRDYCDSIIFFVRASPAIPTSKCGEWTSGWLEELDTRARNECIARGEVDGDCIAVRFNMIAWQELAFKLLSDSPTLRCRFSQLDDACDPAIVVTENVALAVYNAIRTSFSLQRGSNDTQYCGAFDYASDASCHWDTARRLSFFGCCYMMPSRHVLLAFVENVRQTHQPETRSSRLLALRLTQRGRIGECASGASDARDWVAPEWTAPRGRFWFH